MVIAERLKQLSEVHIDMAWTVSNVDSDSIAHIAVDHGNVFNGNVFKLVKLLYSTIDLIVQEKVNYLSNNSIQRID